MNKEGEGRREVEGERKEEKKKRGKEVYLCEEEPYDKIRKFSVVGLLRLSC